MITRLWPCLYPKRELPTLPATEAHLQRGNAIPPIQNN